MVVAFWIEASGSPFRYSQMARATFSGVIPIPLMDYSLHSFDVDCNRFSGILIIL